MRITKLFFTVVAFAFITSNTFATENPSGTSVRKEIKEMVQNAFHEFEGTDKLIINFLINNENEIIVVSTNSKEHESAIKSVLEMKKVKSNDLTQNKLYALPIQFKTL